MKKILLLLLTLITVIFPQEQKISNHVKNFFKIADENSSSYVKKVGLTKKFTDTEIDTITKKYYDAISDDPKGFLLYLFQEDKKWQQEIKNNNYEIKSLKPAFKLALIIKQISKKYGEKFTKIISVPYYLIVNIKSINHTEYNSPSHPELKTSQVDLIVTIEEVIKGDKYFFKGQDITVSYLAYWRQNATKTFKIGNSYLVPIKVWGSNDNFSKLALQILPDNNYALYPVEDDIVKVPGDYLQLGNNINLQTIRKSFRKKYVIN